jgi:hypothetical protein
MALTFLSLVNNVAERLNEVPLTSSNFAGASGFYADAKNYVNAAINRINTQEYEWPFNHMTKTETLVVDQNKYQYPADTKSVPYDTFRLKGSDALNVRSMKLEVLDYEEYLSKYTDHEFNPSDYSDSPRMVVRNRNDYFTIVPPPDQAYEVVFEYYTMPADLINWDDTTNIPESFRWLINEGAMYHAYMFRGALEEAAAANSMFDRGIKDMRKLYINRTEYARSTVIRS